MHLKIDRHHRIEPLTSQNWSDFEELFGRDQGANGGCWCMWWRIPRSAWQQMGKEGRRAAIKQLVDKRAHLGVLLLKDGLAVGWCGVTPPGSLPTYERSRIARPVDDLGAWRISCFYIKSEFRRRGYMKTLVHGAVWFAKAHGAPALDSFPQIMRNRHGYVDTFVGIESCFQACGFKILEARGQLRCAMRIDI